MWMHGCKIDSIWQSLSYCKEREMKTEKIITHKKTLIYLHLQMSSHSSDSPCHINRKRLLVFIQTDWQNTTDPEDSHTLDIGMMKLRWNVNMTLVKRTMKTIYAAFSKSVNWTLLHSRHTRIPINIINIIIQLHQTAKAVFNDNNMIVTCIYASVYTHLFSYLLNFYRTLASFHSEYTRGHQEE